MRRYHLWLGATLVTAALGLPGCNNSPASPGFFAGKTFTGSVARSGSSSHSFTSQQSGPLVITVTSLAPSTIMGLGLGSPVADGCQQSAQAAVQQGDVLQPQADIPPGNYCVVIFDIGNVAESSSVTYSLHVFHK